MGSINAKESNESLVSVGSNGSFAAPADASRPPSSSALTSGEDTVPHVFTWEHGGGNVLLTGTFTGWERHIPMHRSGHDFVTIVDLPRGKHAFKFIVDDDWRFSPEQPVIRDASGNINNYCDLSNFHHNDTEPIDYERKLSNPDVSYGQVMPDFEGYARQPPMLPPHLRHIILNAPAQEEDPHTILRPQHVTLNHLYCTVFRDGLMVQGITQRYKRKFVTTVFYSSADHTTLGRNSGSGSSSAGAMPIPGAKPTSGVHGTRGGHGAATGAAGSPAAPPNPPTPSASTAAPPSMPLG